MGGGTELTHVTHCDTCCQQLLQLYITVAFRVVGLHLSRLMLYALLTHMCCLLMSHICATESCSSLRLQLSGHTTRVSVAGMMTSGEICAWLWVITSATALRYCPAWAKAALVRCCPFAIMPPCLYMHASTSSTPHSQSGPTLHLDSHSHQHDIHLLCYVCVMLLTYML